MSVWLSWVRHWVVVAVMEPVEGPLWIVRLCWSSTSAVHRISYHG